MSEALDIDYDALGTALAKAFVAELQTPKMRRVTANADTLVTPDMANRMVGGRACDCQWLYRARVVRVINGRELVRWGDVTALDEAQLRHAGAPVTHVTAEPQPTLPSLIPLTEPLCPSPGSRGSRNRSE